MIELVTEKPAWFIILCIAAGVIYAAGLYYKETIIPAENRKLRLLLVITRGVLVTFLAFLLLSPLIKSIKREVEKPVIILAQDNSESISAFSDSASRAGYTEAFAGLAEKLKSKYEVKVISWGDKVKDAQGFSFNEKATDFSGMLDELDVRYGNRNVGAVVIATDGLYNRGSNPLYHSSQVKVPYYVVALGDTVVHKDVALGRVNFNKVVYLNNTFPVEVNVEATHAASSQVTLTVMKDSTTVFTRPINISNNRFSQNVTVLLDAVKKGVQHYKIKVSSVSGEVTLLNNEKDIYVEVRESKEKILILSAAPHPDIAAMKQSIESGQNYEAVSFIIDQFDGKVEGYNLVILHQLPSVKHPAQDLFTRLNASGIPMLFVLGSESSISSFNKLSAGLTISSAIGKSNSAAAIVNDDFSLFTLSDETRKALREFPPISSPFGDYRSSGGYALLYQQIGSVQTRSPLLLFSEDGGKRSGVFAGDGFWRWRLNDYLAHDNFNASQEIIQKTIQFLSSKEQKSHFRVTNKISVPENEPVIFDAEVYNENYELINTQDVNLVITNSNKKSFPYVFSKTERAYSLNAGYLSPGEYSFKANVRVGDKSYVKEGAFAVHALQQELTETTADHDLLKSLANKTGGKVFLPSEMKQLGDTLLQRNDKAVSYSSYRLQDLINLKWVFFLLLALISMEWFLRKRSGAY